MLSEELLQSLCENPQEKLDTELKNWIDPSEAHGRVKILKGCQALYNFNGGQMLIGFHSETKVLEDCPWPEEIQERFHEDKIQQLIGKYSSQNFEVIIHFVQLGEKTAIVIEVPSGVKYPVAMKRPFTEDGAPNIKENSIFFRTLSSGNVVGTSVLSHKDIPELFDKCFENREADIGRFIRRHLSGDALGNLSGILNGSLPQNNDELMSEFQDHCRQKFYEAASTSGFNVDGNSFWEVSVLVEGEQAEVPSLSGDWSQRMSQRVPRITGMPLFTSLYTEEYRPRFIENGYQSLIYGEDQVTFWRISPEGRFFLRNKYQDDCVPDRITPGTVFDPLLMYLRIFEVFVTCVEFAKECGFAEGSTLNFQLNFEGLRNRQIQAWANQRYHIGLGGQCVDDHLTNSIKFSIELTRDALITPTHKVMEPILAHFDGYAIQYPQVESLIQNFLMRGY